MTSLTHRLYTGRARSWARRAGITQLLRSPVQLRTYWRRRRFDGARPEQVTMTVEGLAVRGWTRTFHEYQRTLSLVDDRHLIRALARHCRAGDVVWDVGANIGLYSAVLSRLVGPLGQVVAFEPEPRARERLAQNIELNRAGNVRVESVALGRRSERARFFTASEGVDGSHSLVNDSGSGTVLEIDVERGDVVRRKLDLRVPAVVKVDVEGAEDDVLEGLAETLASPTCRAVLCEVHFGILARAGLPDAPTRICETLRAHGLVHQSWPDASHLLAWR